MNVGDIEYTVSVETQQSINAAQNFDKSMTGVQSSAKKTDAEIGKLDVSMTKLAKAIAGVVTISAIYSQFKNAVNVTKEFNATISNLGALTGLAGNELDKLSDAARRIGATTSLSATQAAEGMRLIGSQVPELLKSTDALEGVTQAAAVLAEAAKTDLPSAAQAISGAINQFGLAASDTDDIINTLAAGAKAGASSVEQTAAALAVAGTTAKGAGVSFTEFNALVQTLAQGQITAAEAGTALRNVILRLDTSVDSNLRPSVVGVGTALRNMQKEVAKGTTTYEAFGLVNKTAADVLLQNIDYYEQTAAAIEGTNEAYEQQAKNNDNLLTDLQAMNSAYENLLITVGQRLDPTLRGLTQTMTELLGWLDKGEDGVSNFERGIAALEVAGVSLGAVIAGRVATSIAASSKAFYVNVVAARAKAAADLSAAQSAAALAAQNLIAAQSAERAAAGLSTHAAAARALATAQATATAATAALSASQRAMAGTMSVATVAANGLRTAMMFLGGPVGIALLAATAMYQFATSARDTAADLTNLKAPLADVVDSLKELDAVARDTELRNMRKGVAELEEAYKELGNSLIGTAAYAKSQISSQEASTEAGSATIKMLNQLEEAARKAASGTAQDFESLYNSIKNNEGVTEEFRNSLLNMVAKLSESGREADAAAQQYDNVAGAMSNVASDADKAAAAVDELSGALRTGSAAADEYVQKAGRALEDAQDRSAVGRLSRDIRDNAEQWANATKAQIDAAYAVAFATDKRNAEQAALRKTTTARKQLTEAEREAKKAAEDLRRGNESNTETLDRLRESLYQTELKGRDLVERQAELSLNKYATPEQIQEVKDLAVQLKNAQDQASELERRKRAFGADVDLSITGSVSPLSGGMFDDQAARYEAEAAAEQKRYADAMERLQEAKELELEVRGGYMALEEQMALEHSARMQQIEDAKTQVMMQSAEQGFGAMADIMKTAFGEQSALYKTAFVAQKAAAIAQSIVAIQQGIAMAAANPWPLNIGAMASVAAATAGIVSNIAGTQIGSRRQGGPVAAGSMYRVNEGGAPEIFQNNLGQQYMMPNSRGEVISNKDASKGGGVVINIHNAPQGTKMEQSESPSGQEMIDIWIADFTSDGRTASVVQNKFGLAAQGR